MTEPDRLEAARRQLNAKAAVRCSALLGVGVESRTDAKHDAPSDFSARPALPKACVVCEAERVEIFGNPPLRREETA